EWRTKDGGRVEHLHYVTVLPDAETLRGVALHGFKRRVQQARRLAESELELRETGSLSKTVNHRASRLGPAIETHDAAKPLRSWRELDGWLHRQGFELNSLDREGVRGAYLVARDGTGEPFGLSKLGARWRASELERRFRESITEYLMRRQTKRKKKVRER
ncbi:MAG: hypothetical protein HQL38_15785, partial [Alphaproteobacteria bacterium]|nr:hypothetical protein [Alphaproteobacteria bacterium]